MPGFDRTGPMGAGPMTGGRRGMCGGAAPRYEVPFYDGYGYGRGMGFRRGMRGGFGPGRGRGFGRRFFGYPAAYGYPHPASPTDELEMLRADADAMRRSLEAVQKRIAELNSDSAE